ncbi:MAG: UDP-N-acetylmuramate dehydrogenase [Bernardetiaceae bacterium]|nr:UDP-N-acetylmuramate dehydrogenase [Bernardetiaceae bacterium]
MTPNIQHNVSLKTLNTFGIDVLAKQFVQIQKAEELPMIFKKINSQKLPYLILGGGSNVLLIDDINALVLQNQIQGVRKIEENTDTVLLEVGAGENWHNLVRYCVTQNWGGLENLSLIPGTVGAAPMQNIGAYGVEQEYCFESLRAYHITTGKWHEFDKASCAFGYRESVFKNKLKGQYFITAVRYRLHKNPIFNIQYQALKEYLETHTLTPNLNNISQAVIAIRESKLPDPKIIGNSGSFFKNPIISAKKYQHLITEFPNMPSYHIEAIGYKIPAAWLIEACGWKGKIVGNTGTFAKQALVLVNHGQASGQEILHLAEQIQASVIQKFDIALQPEVNIISNQSWK